MKSVRTIAAGVAVAALALTGCTPPPSTAASVEGVRIPTETVTVTGDKLVSLGANPAVAYKQAAFDLMLGEASRQIAAQTGTPVGDDERAAILARDPNAQTMADSPQGRAWAEAVSTTYVVLERVGDDDFASRLGDLDIEVNPRYGTWSPDRITLTDSALSRASDGLANR